MDVSLAVTAIAGVLAYDFAQQLFYRWDERSVLWQRQTSKCEVGSGKAAAEGAGVVGVRERDMLGRDLMAPEGMDFLGLSDAARCQLRIGPGHGVVAVQFRPIRLSNMG